MGTRAALTSIPVAAAAVPPLAVGGGAVVAGLAAAQDPRLAVLGVVGVLGVVIAVIDVTAAVAGFTVLAIAWFGSAPRAAIVGGVILGVGWLAAVGFARGRARPLPRQRPALGWLIAALLAWMALTLAWAHDVHAGLDAMSRYVVALLLLPVVFVAVRRRRQAVVVIGAFVFGAAGSAVLSVFTMAPGEDGRFQGPTTDPNTFAAVLLPAAVLGGALSLRPVGLGAGARFAAAGAAAIAVVGTVATGSRGALVGIAVLLVAMPLFGGRPRRSALAVAGVVALVATAALTVPGSAERTQLATRGLNSSGRNDLWTVGWRMVEARPVGGVGVGNFRAVSADYLIRPGAVQRAQYIVDTPLVAHNSYLQVWSETGTIGLGLFSGVVLACLGSAFRAARRFEQAGDVGSALLARAVLIASVVMLATLFFLSYLDYGRPLWILLALGPALLGVSTRTAR